jgi:N-acetylneuraminate synthase
MSGNHNQSFEQAVRIVEAAKEAGADAVRVAEVALGVVHYEPTDREAASRVFRRSFFVVEDTKAGEVFTTKNVRSIRPAHGLAPKHLPEVLGRRAARDVARGTPLARNMVS